MRREPSCGVSSPAEHALGHGVQRRQPSEVELAWLHPDQVRALRLQRAERRDDRGWRREELPDQPQPLADVLQDVFEAVRRVAGGVERMGEPQHEQRRVLLLGGMPEEHTPATGRAPRRDAI